jgi:hypothetical protein
MKTYKELINTISEAATSGRSEIVAHMKKLGKQSSYENQGGAHAYWFKNDSKLSSADVHKHIKSLDKSASLSKEYNDVSGKHKGQSYSIEHQGKMIHVRLHKSGAAGAADIAGKD